MDSAEVALPIPTNNTNNKHTHSESPKKEIDESAYRGVRWLEDLLCERFPNRPPLTQEQIESGARALQQIHEQGYAWRDISDISVWVENNPFWRSRILDCEAFTRHFDKIHAQYYEDEDSA